MCSVQGRLERSPCFLRLRAVALAVLLVLNELGELSDGDDGSALGNWARVKRARRSDQVAHLPCGRAGVLPADAEFGVLQQVHELGWSLRNGLCEYVGRLNGPVEEHAEVMAIVAEPRAE